MMKAFYKMKTLHLNVHRKWFDMIKSTKKLEEYRAISPYWVRRLLQNHEEMDSLIEDEMINDLKLLHSGKSRFDSFHTLCIYFGVGIKKYDTITFSNGYRKDRYQFMVKCLDISVGEGVEEWGATPGINYFRIVLGKILEQ